MWHDTYMWPERARDINSKEGSGSVLLLLLLLGCSEVASGTLWGNQGNWHRVGRSALSHRLVKIEPEKEADVDVETGEQRDIHLSQTSHTSITSMHKQKYSINHPTQTADWARAPGVTKTSACAQRGRGVIWQVGRWGGVEPGSLFDQLTTSFSLSCVYKCKCVYVCNRCQGPVCREGGAEGLPGSDWGGGRGSRWIRFVLRPHHQNMYIRFYLCELQDTLTLFLFLRQEWWPWPGLWCCTPRSWQITPSSLLSGTGGRVRVSPCTLNTPLTYIHVHVFWPWPPYLSPVLLQGPSSSWAGWWPLKSSSRVTTTSTPCNHNPRSRKTKLYLSAIIIFSCVLYSCRIKKIFKVNTTKYIIYWNMTYNVTVFWYWKL